MRLKPIHPGEVLLEEFLKPLNLNQTKLAHDLRVPTRRINDLVLGKRRLTLEIALRLARYFGNSVQFWLGLQMDYDIDLANLSLTPKIQSEVPVYLPPS
jgi:addiction module HigA family antidote